MTDEQEIKQSLDNLADTFARLDIEAWLNCFHNPRLIVMQDNCYTLATEKERLEVMAPRFQYLKESGFNKSSLNLCNIKFLSENTAFVSTVWTRYADDVALEEFAATYLFQKIENIWKPNMVTSHSSDIVLVQ